MVIDPRVAKMGDVLINYSLAVQPGDTLLIQGPPAAAPLIREAYRAALKAGGHPVVRVSLPGIDEIMFAEASDEQLQYLPRVAADEVEFFDTRLNIRAAENTKSLSGVDPKRVAMHQTTLGTLGRRVMERAAAGELRWCATLFPTEAHAQDAEMSLTDYENFVFGSCLLDQDDPAAAWERVRDAQQHITDYLMAHDTIRIVGEGTEVTYRVGGRTWINSDGKRNFPSGEVFTGPREDSVEGHVRFSYPAIYNGREVEDVRLTFRGGKVVEARATRGEEFLHAMLDTDPGARFLGEVAFGLNYGIQRFTRNILFDEKIGGTMHMALGRSYPDSGGRNDSAIHWDLICDLRDGEVYADGELCYRDGKFIV
jgi:aminopeptidase